MIPFPDKKYDIIYADPPWQHDADKKGNFRALHYLRMTQKEICNLPVQSIAKPNCVLYLWTTSPHTADAIEVISSWGFLYKSQYIWVKNSIGLGFWARNQHELLLVAVGGKVSPPEQSLRKSSIINVKRGKHSVKPMQAKQMIETYHPNTDKIELFARPLPMQKFFGDDGWDYWGNEVVEW